MERASRSYLNGKELLVVVVIPLELSDQLRIVFERCLLYTSIGELLEPPVLIVHNRGTCRGEM